MNNVKLLIGNNIISKNENEFKIGSRALIVTGKTSAKKSGALDDVINVLKKLNIEYDIFDEICQNPLLEDCFRASKLYEKCDFVIGIGGGSPLDASKAIAVLLANKDLDEETFFNMKWPNKPLPIILVGTTAGTGSEVTDISVLTTSNMKKRSVHDKPLYAKLAFGDPKYLESLSYEFTLSTALDALAHAIESYLSNKANDESRSHSIKAFNYLYKNIIDLSNADREQLYRGSIEGGYAIDITGTTFAHNVGYLLTENYHVPHGIACYTFMNDLLEFHEKNNNDYFNMFLKDIKLSKTELFAISDLMPKLNIKMTKEEITDALPRWENNSTVNNTFGKINIIDIEKILIKNFNK